MVALLKATLRDMWVVILYVGGLVGWNHYYSNITQSYWNTDAIARGVGYSNRSVDVERSSSFGDEKPDGYFGR